jgi:hypothetical protein
VAGRPIAPGAAEASPNHGEVQLLAVNGYAAFAAFELLREQTTSEED